jgi:5-methylcytosine-specific restriction endonuclease McrA
MFGGSIRKRKTKARLVARDGLKCCWCGREIYLNVPFSNDDFATIEHIKPVCKGGSSARNNLALACRLCNNSRRLWGETQILKRMPNHKRPFSIGARWPTQKEGDKLPQEQAT